MSDETNNSLSAEDSVIIGSDEDNGIQLGALESENGAGTEKLISRDIESAITREVISNVNMERVDSLLDCRAYLVDFSVGDITVVASWLKSLKNFIVSDKINEVSEEVAKKNKEREQTGNFTLRADAAMYFKTKSGISFVGFVDQLQMYKTIRDYIYVSFGDKVKVYVKKEGENVFNVWKSADISGARLNL